jgi:glycolate oxidase
LEMPFGQINPEILQSFKSILPEEDVMLDEESLLNYGSDETEDLSFPPEVVLKPSTTEQVSEILSICHHHKIPVTPLGARTGLSGGALSIHGGVGLSMERFNRIIHIDENNLQATVEPGVINQVFQDAVKENGLFYPPDPASWGSCFLGGNLALNSGGPRAVKYGVTKDYVLNLEVVLANGEVMWTGANTLKNSTGYNLTQLMIGSEGTLGVITKAVFRLIPKPTEDLLMLVPFANEEKACEAVPAIFKAGVIPSAMEFMERDAIDWVMKYVDGISLEVTDEVQAHLLIEVDGNDPEALMKDCEKIMAVLEHYEAGEILFADSAAQKEMLWKMRRRVGEAVKANSIYKEEDTVVPRYEMPKLLVGVKEIGKRYGFHSVCYGHVGDGNLHVNIIKGELTDQQWEHELPKAIREIFKLCVDLGGTLSGEHGIGYVQKNYMDIAFRQSELDLQKRIKQSFDPKGILNPSKVFPD